MTSIPSNANWFYASDSYSLTLIGSGVAPYVQYWYPGVANQSANVSANSSVSIYLKSCSLVVAPIGSDSSQGINADMRVGLYLYSGAGTPEWYSSMPFKSPYGTANYAIVMNSVSKLSNNSPRAFREFGIDTPLIVGGATPVTNSSIQVGLGFQLNFGTSPITTQIEYHIHGAYL